jgi:prefoldin alpha subunit
MVDRSELQQKARLVESHRQHLEELQKRMEDVSAVVAEHQITAEILNRLSNMAEEGKASAHVTIGSGVTLNYKHEGKKTGTALIDLGGGIFAEREWQDAANIIEKRKDDFIQIHESLLTQAGSIEQRLGTLASEFNAAAEKLQSLNQAPEAKPVETSKTENSESKPQKRRRGSRFGGELTLDD